MPLDPDHPGFRDLAYRSRRNEIAALAHTLRPGAPAPSIMFLPEEHAVWRTVWSHLGPLHRQLACQPFLEARLALPLDHEMIPQLDEVNAALRALPAAKDAFQLVPVAGLVSSQAFLSRLSQGVFLATQYIRHHSVPLYTPEPDIVHELVGHAITFADPRFVALNRAFGRAALRATDASAAQLANLYWYTMEFGVVWEGASPKAYGAGLLSSFGELARLPETTLLPLDCDHAAATPYDPTSYQRALFAATDWASLERDLFAWLEAF